jgi:hypothetical protein
MSTPEILELRHEVARLRDVASELRIDIRTLRAALAHARSELVLVDADGRERIVMHATDGAAVITLNAFSGSDDDEPAMTMQLVAVDARGGEPARVGGASFVAGRDVSVRGFGNADESAGIAALEDLLAAE